MGEVDFKLHSDIINMMHSFYLKRVLRKKSSSVPKYIPIYMWDKTNKNEKKKRTVINL